MDKKCIICNIIIKPPKLKYCKVCSELKYNTMYSKYSIVDLKYYHSNEDYLYCSEHKHFYLARDKCIRCFHKKFKENNSNIKRTDYTNRKCRHCGALFFGKSMKLACNVCMRKEITERIKYRKRQKRIYY